MDLEQTALLETGKTLVNDPAGWTAGAHAISPPQHELQAPLEQVSARKDSLHSNAALFKYFPKVIKYDLETTKGIPKSWPAVGDFLLSKTGHAFPILGRLQHSRGICAVAATIADNLDVTTSSLELELKYFVAMVFGTFVATFLAIFVNCSSWSRLSSLTFPLYRRVQYKVSEITRRLTACLFHFSGTSQESTPV